MIVRLPVSLYFSCVAPLGFFSETLTPTSDLPVPLTSRHHRWEVANTHANLAYAELHTGHLEAAKKELTEALSSVPDSWERTQWLVDLGHVLVLLGKFKTPWEVPVDG